MNSLPRNRSAQEAVYSWLQDFVAGVPRYDTVILSENEIATSCGTSRTPVREALHRLATEGTIQIVSGKGAIVAPVSDKEVMSIMTAREAVETWSVRNAANAHDDDVIAELHELLNRQRELVDDPGQFIKCDRQFHGVLVRSSGNNLLADFYETLRERQLRLGVQAVTGSGNRAARVIQEHGTIVRAIDGANPTKAVEDMTLHLHNTLASLMSPSVGPANQLLTPPDLRPTGSDLRHAD